MFVEKEIIMDIYKLVEVFLRKSTLVSLLFSITYFTCYEYLNFNVVELIIVILMSCPIHKYYIDLEEDKMD